MQRNFYLLLLLCAGLLSQAQVSSNVTFQGNLTYSQDLSDIWGWYDAVNNREYAIVGLFNGTSFVDVTDPTNPVQVQFVPGNNSIWRDMKTYSHYAYIVTEGGGGLQIVDMSGTPGSWPVTTWTGGLGYNSSHNIFIDENGIIYLCGSNTLGTLFLDPTVTPTNPQYIGNYDLRYIHDLYVENDIMYSAEINNGIFSVVDVSNKTSPNVLATQSTTSNFTHNIWLSTDGNYVFTTDEVGGANVDAYDISDLSDIQRVDEFRPPTGSSSIPHNTFVKDNFVVTAWYRDGLRITDATNPDNLIEVGFYDTSPLSGGGFNGAWGTYPYLPSGNALVADIEEGLFVLTPSYVGAAFLSGQVTDAGSGAPLFDATVEIIGSGLTAETDLFGNYSTGLAGGGTFDVQVSRLGYATQTVSGVSLSAGATTTLDVGLIAVSAFSLTGQIVDAGTSAGIPFAQVELAGPSGTYNITADASGNFTVGGVFPDDYDVRTGKWGYITEEIPSLALSTGSSPLIIDLDVGYYDDFTFDFGWTGTGTSSTGNWTRGEPIGTDFSGIPINPEVDAAGDFSDQCFMTGNDGGSAGTDDVDGGRTVLRSPIFDLSGSSDPTIQFDRWFANDGGSTAPDDSLIIRISDGVSTATVDIITASDPNLSTWVSESFRVLDFVTLTSNMQFIVETSDLTEGHLVEGAIDAFEVVGGSSVGCVAPTNPISSSVTSSSATISWDPVVGAGGYRAQGRKVGTGSFRSRITTNTFTTITGLASSTSYEWQVQVQCSDGSLSPYTTLEIFTTTVLREAPNRFDIQPNPAQDFTTINWDASNLEEELDMILVDMQGRTLRQFKLSGLSGQMSLDLQGLSAGMYFIRAANEEVDFSEQLIISE